MRSKTLLAVGATASLAVGSFFVNETKDIYRILIPIAFAGAAGGVYPEWDNINSRAGMGQIDASPTFRLANIKNGTHPFDENMIKRMETGKTSFSNERVEKAVKDTITPPQTHGFSWEPHSILALIVAVIPFALLWLTDPFGNILNTSYRDVGRALTIGFALGYILNLTLQSVSFGVFSRGGIKLFWPVSKKRIGKGLVKSEEILPDEKSFWSDMRTKKEKRLSRIISFICLLTAIAVSVIKLFG